MTAPPVRWTEHGPEPVESEADAVPPDVSPAPTAEDHAPLGTTEDPASVVARLKAKGLLRTEPSIRIRDLAGDAPRPLVTFEPEQPLTTGRHIDDDDLGDPEELEPELPGPTTDVRCPSCRTPQAVPDTSTGYRCRSCSKVWRWAQCSGCHVVSLTIARQESWRCPCGAYTRSWWRTPTRAAEHKRTAEARAAQAAEQRRRQAYEKARRRRWKVLSAGALAIVITAAAAITISKHAAPVTTRGPSGRVCDEFATVQQDIDRNVPLAAIRTSVDTLAADAVDAVDAVRLPAQRLAGSGHPGDKPFDKAAADLARACAG
jgi:hypothetical protein